MSDSLVPPPAGWYPAPNGSGEQWWWDGAQWNLPNAVPQSAQQAQQPQPAQPVPPQQEWQQAAAQTAWQQPWQQQPRNTEGIARLSMAVQILLWIGAGFSLITIFVELFGLSVIREFLDDPFVPGDKLMTYAGLSSGLAIVASIVLIATGICWVIWQFQVAKQLAGLTRRTPGWHIGSWFIPIVSFWFPYQNISDLWKAIGLARPSWQPLWWACWLASGVTSQISARILMDSDELDVWQSAMIWGIGAELLTLISVPFAWLIVRGITDGVRKSPVYVTPIVAQ